MAFGVKAANVRNLSSDVYLRQSALLFVGSLLISAINYTYYPALGRLLPLPQFGEVQTLVALFTQSLIIFQALNIVVVNLLIKPEEKSQVLRELQNAASYIVLAVALVGALLWPPLSAILHLTSPLAFFLLLVALTLNIPLSFFLSFFQGQRLFGGINLLSGIVAASRLLLAIVLIRLGFGVVGAVAAIIIGQLLSLAAGKLFYRSQLPSLRVNWPAWSIVSDELPFLFLAAFATFSMTFLYSGDVLIAKHYFLAAESGRYAGISALSNVIFFATIPLSMVMLPHLHPDQPSESRLALKKTLVLILGLGLAILLGFWFYGGHIVSLVIGRRYAPLSPLLPILAGAVLLFSLTNALMFYLLSIRSIKAAFVAVISLLFYGGIVLLHHSNPLSVAENSLLAGLVAILLAGGAVSGKLFSAGRT